MPFIINLKTNYSSFNIAIPFNMPESSLAASIPAYNDSLSCIFRSISTARIYVSGYKSLLTSKNDKAACTNPSDVNLVSFFSTSCSAARCISFTLSIRDSNL